MRRAAATLLCIAMLSACDGRQVPVVLHDPASPPERLSDWGLVYVDAGRLVVNAAAVPYELNTPLFSDYALKLRTVWVPEGSSAEYLPGGDIAFPVGTILSKTFHYEKAADTAAIPRVIRADRPGDPGGSLSLEQYLLIETRLLVRAADGWHALPYVWNAAQDEAFLAIAGDLLPIELVAGSQVTSFSYIVPDANQCANCHTPDHTAGALQPLGPQAWQLNRDYDYGSKGRSNQLARWDAAGLLSGVPDAVPTGVSWAKPGVATLEERARAYLDANCAHCHNARGAADTSALHLDLEAPLNRHFGICKSPVAVGRGSGDRPYDIFPGRPEDSILVYRMEHSDPAIAMPELGRGIVHAEGVALLRDWIAALPGEC